MGSSRTSPVYLKWWILPIVLCCLLIVPSLHHANQPNPPSDPTPVVHTLVTAGGVCANFSGNLIRKIVDCLTNMNPAKPMGAIPFMAKAFLEHPLVSTLISGISKALFTMAVVFMGIKMMYLPDARITKKDMWILVAKIAMISWLISQPFYFYTIATTTLDELMRGISGAISLQICPGVPANDIWTTFGCITEKLIGYGVGVGATAGLAAMILMFFFSGAIGWLIAITGVYIMLKLLFTVARVVHLYVMAYIGIAFMFCVSFLFVPCLMFQQTRGYFDKWLKLTVGYILTPIFLFAYIGFALIAMREIILCGPNSFVVRAAGPGASVCTGTGDVAGAVVNGGIRLDSAFTATASSNPGDAKAGTISGSGQGGVRQSGDTNAGAGSAQIKVPIPRVDFAKAASNAGSPSQSAWLKGILIAAIASSLLIYVLYEILDYIPEFATKLAYGGVQQGSIARERAVGEVFATAAVVLARDAPIAMAKGFVTGGKAGAVVEGLKALNKFRKDATAKDGRELR